MKTKKFAIWLGVIVFFSTISYLWGILWNNIYSDGTRVFFLANRLNDIIDTIWSAMKEEVLWRFIPLIAISFILSLIKFESSKKKKYISCSIAFVIILLIQIRFGLAHYSIIYETEDWMIKHIILQGTMGVFYATAYNIIQYYVKKTTEIHLIFSHLIGLLSSFIIHSVSNILLIIGLTF